jgi:hypothetical protein
MRQALAVLLVVLMAAPAWADRYRCANGNTNDANSWSATSGGACTASAPTSADVCYFDAVTPNGTTTVNATLTCKGLDFTGYTGTLAGTAGISSVSGNFVLSTGMTWTYTGTIAVTNASNAAMTITSNGATQSATWTVDTLNGSMTLADAYIGTAGFAFTRGVFSDGGNAFRTLNFTTGGAGNTSVRTIQIAADWSITGSGGTNIFAFPSITNLTWTPTGTPTIKFTDTSSANHRIQVNVAGFNFGTTNIWLNNGANGGALAFITGMGTFADIKIDAGAHTFTLVAGQTLTISSLTTNGALGAVTTIVSSSAGTPATISDSSGTNVCDYCSIQDSTATGGATWNATHSTNVSGNTGWNFLTSSSPYYYGLIQRLMGDME